MSLGMSAARIRALAKAQRLPPQAMVGMLLRLTRDVAPAEIAAQWRALRVTPLAGDASFRLLQTPPSSFAKGDVSDALDGLRDVSADE